ncbi:hypothetical protein IMPR6_690259 [Imperialibacter sp. EC-SDR9]|nr:hypothetical protein IMPERIA89_340259 [Imperialibacter sp. 89]CAD5297337.1 hypothetical protein IMPERIA75_700259 [Imperialibacter sp. 75]VVT34087.1 hypothetical protein IMPR6_690259 [Imperialibacter sp. EC-SDR9]
MQTIAEGRKYNALYEFVCPILKFVRTHFLAAHESIIVSLLYKARYFFVGI